jgi:hypothetical protein
MLLLEQYLLTQDRRQAQAEALEKKREETP